MPTNLGWLDLSILIFMVGGSIVLGIWLGRKNQTAEDFLVGGRSLPWWAILGSIVATETSTATVLSIPGVAYGKDGFLFLQLALGFLVGRLFVATILLPQFFSGNLISAYQVLGNRFGKSVQLFASLMFLVTRNLGDGLRLFLAAIVLQQIFGWPIVFSAIFMGVVTIVYTVLGGVKSVIWNDCIHLVVYLVGGILVAILLLTMIPGGWNQYLVFIQENGKMPSFAFSPSDEIPFWKWLVSEKYSFWAGLIGGGFLTIGTHGTDQMMIQRYLSARSLNGARLAVSLSGIFVFLQFFLFLAIGTLLACFYCHATAEAPEKGDKVFAYFIANDLPSGVGLAGLLLAAIFASSMSTLSSSLAASASAVWNDFLGNSNSNKTPQKNELLYNRILIVIFGILQVLMSIGATYLSEDVVSSALAISGFSAGILLGLFALGLFAPHTNAQAALSGAIGGTCVLVFVKFGMQPAWQLFGYQDSTSVAWPWLALIGFLSTSLIATISSKLFFQNESLENG